MRLQHPIMLAGLAAVAVPIVLHFLSRVRLRLVPWGAMMFLDGSSIARGHSGRFRGAALLALRMTLVAVLALALARPVIGRSIAPRTRAVILLNDSHTMGYSLGDQSRFDEARQAARAVLSSITPGDQAQIILLCDPQNSPAPTADLATLAESLDDLRISENAPDIPGTLTAANADLAFNGNTKFFLITDRQQETWRAIEAARSSLQSPVDVIAVGGWETGYDGDFNLNPVDAEKFAAMLTKLDFRQIQPSQIRETNPSSSGPMELWPELLGVAIGLGILELLVERRWQ